MKTIAIYLSLTVLFILTSCFDRAKHLKDEYLIDFNAFVSDTKTNYTKFTNDDWEKTYQNYNKLLSKYPDYEIQMTESDKKHVDELKGEFWAMVTKSKAKKFKEGVVHMYNQTESLLKNLTK